jgi:hypothetical protein
MAAPLPAKEVRSPVNVFGLLLLHFNYSTQTSVISGVNFKISVKFYLKRIIICTLKCNSAHPQKTKSVTASGSQTFNIPNKDLLIYSRINQKTEAQMQQLNRGLN